VFRTVTYRLYPTSRQSVALARLLGSQCAVYNAALEERRGRWASNRESVTWVDQFKQLTGARNEIPSLCEFGLAPHRGTLKRVDQAFTAFFRRVRAGQTPGYPRFKSTARFNSVTYPTIDGWKLYVPEGRTGTYGRLRLKGVGHVQTKLHRHFDGAVATKLVIRRRGTRWEATVFFKQVSPRVRPPLRGVDCGVDRGLTVIAAVADSGGGSELVENPRHLAQAAKSLAHKQQRLSRQVRGSKRWARTRTEIGACHRRVAVARRDMNHQLSRRLVNRFDLIALERLPVMNMVRRPRPVEDPGCPGTFLPNGASVKRTLNRSILDAGWSQLGTMVAYKAEEAGRRVVYVDPRHTSQRCSQCGHVARDNRNGALFSCKACGHEQHADVNAAVNVLNAARQRFGRGSATHV
jgi:putative transposase